MITLGFSKRCVLFVQEYIPRIYTVEVILILYNDRGYKMVDGVIK